MGGSQWSSSVQAKFAQSPGEDVNRQGNGHAEVDQMLLTENTGRRTFRCTQWTFNRKGIRRSICTMCALFNGNYALAIGRSTFQQWDTLLVHMPHDCTRADSHY